MTPAQFVSILVPFFLTYCFFSAKATPQNRSQVPFAMSVSGGVSLGAYQAGFLYYQTQFLRENRERFQPWIFTGSSAGAINALISIIEYCEETSRPLDDSLYWETWRNIGFKQLTPGKRHSSATVSPKALFSNQALLDRAALIEARWKNGLPKTCDMALGMTATLLEPETIDLSTGISIQRQTMRFVFRIRGRGPGVSPLVENYVPDSAEGLVPKLYLDPDPEKRFAQLRDLALASAAFPAAFDPVPLRICRTQSGTECPFAKSEIQQFVDGGILENQPLRLALSIARQSMVVGSHGEVSFSSHPVGRDESAGEGLPDSFLLRHVDTDARGYPTWLAEAAPEDENRFLIHLMRFGLNLVSTARTRELYSLLEEEPTISSRISSAVTYFPRASDPWGAFFGFFDRGFRDYDFLLGVAEAKRSLESVKTRFPHVSLREPPFSGGSQQESFSCVFAYADPRGVHLPAVPAHCVRPEHKNTRALAQAMWARLAEGCLQRTPTGNEQVVYHSCQSLWQKGTPPWIDPAYENLSWRRKTAELDEGAYFLRLLQEYGYRFDPQEFHNGDDSVESQLAAKVDHLLTSLSNRQPPDDRRAIRALGDNLANQIHYRYPETVAYLLLGDTSELGLTFRELGALRLREILRMGAIVQASRFHDLFKANQGLFSVAPLVALEADLVQFRLRTVALKAAVRAGFIFAAADRWGQQPCKTNGADYVGGCSGPTFQPAAVATYLEHLRMQLLYRTAFPSGQRAVGETAFQLGVQLPF